MLVVVDERQRARPVPQQALEASGNTSFMYFVSLTSSHVVVEISWHVTSLQLVLPPANLPRRCEDAASQPGPLGTELEASKSASLEHMAVRLEGTAGAGSFVLQRSVMQELQIMSVRP